MEVLRNKTFLTPTDIASSSGIRVNHISKILKDLKDKDLIYCANEELRKGRMYTLSHLGLDVCNFYCEMEGTVFDFGDGDGE